MSNSLERKNIKYDSVGMILSVLCGVHCLITPLLLIFQPLIGKAYESTWFHTGMMILILFVFYQSIYKKFKLYRSKLPLGLGLAGIGIFLITYINELYHHAEDEGHGDHHGHLVVPDHSDETSMIYLGILASILLVSAHIINIKKSKRLMA